MYEYCMFCLVFSQSSETVLVNSALDHSQYPDCTALPEAPSHGKLHTKKIWTGLYRKIVRPTPSNIYIV